MEKEIKRIVEDENKTNNLGYEVIRGEIRVKNVGNPDHDNICDSLGKGIYDKLRDKNKTCKVRIENMFVRPEMTREDSIPDVVVFCDDIEIKKIEDGPNKGYACVNDANLIIEVHSRKTKIKAFDKLFSYRRLPSITEIAYFDRDSKRVNLFRKEKNGSWESTVITEGEIEFKGIGVTLSLNEIYGF